MILARRHHTHMGHERMLNLYYTHAHKEVKNEKKHVYTYNLKHHMHTYTHTFTKTIYNEEINLPRNLDGRNELFI